MKASRPVRRRSRTRRGYADSIAIIVIAAILIMIAVIYGLTQLGHVQGAPIASPSFPPQSESPSPSGAPSATPSSTVTPSGSPLPTVTPYRANK